MAPPRMSWEGLHDYLTEFQQALYEDASAWRNATKYASEQTAKAIEACALIAEHEGCTCHNVGCAHDETGKHIAYLIRQTSPVIGELRSKCQCERCHK